MDFTRFPLSETQYLKINLGCVYDDECKYCSQIDIDYIDEEESINIRFGFANLQDFCFFIAESRRIQDILDGKLVLPLDILDPGFEFNECYEKEIRVNRAMDYHCWSNSHNHVRPFYNSWMHNDQDGNIVFQITPLYPWHRTTKKDFPNRISYNKFIKNYKPIIKVLIPKVNLLAWIDQAKVLENKYFKDTSKIL